MFICCFDSNKQYVGRNGGGYTQVWIEQFPTTITFDNTVKYIAMAVRNNTQSNITPSFIRTPLFKMEEGRRVTPWTPSTSDQQLSLNVVNALDATFAEARQATTNIQGGLVLTNTIIAGEGTDQSGMTGTQSTNVAFWAGGTLEQAKANTAPVVINRNGNAKFGQVYIDGNGAMKMNDSNGKVCLEISRNISINPPTSWENSSYPNFNTITLDKAVVGGQQFADTYTMIEEKTISSNIPSRYWGFSFTFGDAFINLTVSDAPAQQTISFEIRIYDGKDEQTVYAKTVMGDLQNQPISAKTITVRGSMIKLRTYMLATSGKLTYYSDTIKYRFKSDPTQTQTVFAQKGLGLIVNTDNFFRLAYDAAKNCLIREFKGVIKEDGLIVAGVYWSVEGPNLRIGNELQSLGIIKVEHERPSTGVHKIIIKGLSSNLPVMIASPYKKWDTSGDLNLWVDEPTYDETTTKWTFIVRTFQGNSAYNSHFSFAIYGRLA